MITPGDGSGNGGGQPILEMRGITKRFPGVLALDNVSIQVYPGECLGLVGENGAGKTTLIELLNPHEAPTGFFRQDEGVILLDGAEVWLRDPKDALQRGISIVHQHSNLIPSLTVSANMFLGIEPRSRVIECIDQRTVETRCCEILNELGIEVDARSLVADLTYAQTQMIELARVLLYDSRLVVVDEITAALDTEDTARIFAVLRQLKQRNIGMIFIGHRLEEVFEICDRIAILRDGRLVGEAHTTETNKQSVIQSMVGRELIVPERRIASRRGKELLTVDNLCGAGFVRNVSFSLREGEILGVAGLVGAGRSEVASLIFGSVRPQSGTIFLDGTPISVRRPKDALRLGIGMVPENRQRHGLVLSMSVGQNLTLTVLKWMAGALGFVRSNERQVAEDYIRRLRIVTSSPDKVVKSLSGGNQQKVVLGKWLAAKLRVLIVDEPTKGVDVGAKAEIHRILRDVADRGIGVLMISSELPEVIGVSDRIMVMCEGEVTRIFDTSEVTQEEIMRYATYSRKTA